MSHIEKCETKIEIKDDTLLSHSIAEMEKEGYKVLKSTGKYEIDLRSRGITHYYTKTRQEEKWSFITIKKENKSWNVSGDPWSIEQGFNNAIKSLENNYVVSGLQQAMKKAGYMAPKVKKESGKIVIRAIR